MTIINGYFRPQAVTGQQRYATEVADRLLERLPGVRELTPRWPGARSREWLELQTRLPFSARRETLVSLTARAPVVASRHVVTIHDLFPLTNPEWFSRQYAALHGRLLKHHLHTAAAIAVVSEPVREQVQALTRPGIPLVVAPNAPSRALGRAAASSTFEPPPAFMLTVGSLEPRKNLGRLIEGYSLLPAGLRRQYPLLIAGGTAAAFPKTVDLPTSALEDVRFCGRVSDDELAVLYRRASVFVSTSLAEGFGLPIVEIADAGACALVLSDIPVYRWVTGGEATIFVEPTSVESIRAGLERAIEAPPDPSGLEAIGRRFSWDSTADRFAELITRTSQEATAPEH